MSTKTSIKRIALVAVAALSFGGVSVITATSANATVNAAISPVQFKYKTMYDTTNGYQVVGGQATVEIGVDSTTTSTVSITGVGSIVSASDTNTINVGYETITGLTSTSFNINANARLGVGVYETVTLVLTSAVAGTSTISVVSLDANGVPNTPTTKTVTWTAAGSTAAASWSAYLVDTTSAGAGIAPADSTVPLTYSKGTSSANVAFILAKLKDSNGNAVANASVTAVVTGPGLIAATNQTINSDGTLAATNGATGTSRAAALTTNSSGWVAVALANDLTAGTSTVTFTSGTVSVSKAVTFIGGAATLTAVASTGTYRVGVNPINSYDAGSVSEDSSTGYAFKVKGVDSAGNLVKAGTVYAKSSNTAVATVSAVAHDFATNKNGYVYFLVTGVAAGKATITIQDTNPAGSTAPTASTTIDIQVTTGGADSIAIATDKSSYAPGEPGTLTITLKNSTGDPVADGTYTIFGSTTKLLSNLQVTGYATGPNASAWSQGITSVTTSGGVAAFDFYAPNVGSSLTFSGTTLAATTVSADVTANARAKALTATAAIAGGANGGDAALALDAANAATDAANNAYDEAQNATQAAQDALAAVTSLAKQVSSLIASVKSLTALVSKIKAKVGA